MKTIRGIQARCGGAIYETVRYFEDQDKAERVCKKMNKQSTSIDPPRERYNVIQLKLE